jgi:hypothetical protein
MVALERLSKRNCTDLADEVYIQPAERVRCERSGNMAPTSAKVTMRTRDNEKGVEVGPK